MTVLFIYVLVYFNPLKSQFVRYLHTHIHELYISLCILISGSRGTRLNNSILCQYIYMNYSDCTDVLPQTGWICLWMIKAPTRCCGSRTVAPGCAAGLRKFAPSWTDPRDTSTHRRQVGPPTHSKCLMDSLHEAFTVRSSPLILSVQRWCARRVSGT